MPLYFAYGANMDRAAMAQRCPRSKPLGTARLENHALAIMVEGWLTITPSPNAEVHGVLWDLAEADVAALDLFEDVPSGLYVKALLLVGEATALVYVGTNAGPGRARPDYLAAVIAAARDWGLPTAPLAKLQPPVMSPER